jgi:Ca2+-binding EF-hand superfamily protein
MSLSVNASTNNNAYLYLQSLLQQGPQLSSTSGSSDPISQLLGATDSQSASSASATTPASSGAATGSGSTTPQFGTETFTALISLQMNGSATGAGDSSQSLFSQFDTDGDGSISQSEFDSKFASADQSQANAMFAALDSNGDGSVSQGELASAQQSAQGQQAHGHHHHHHMGGAGGGGQSQGSSPFDMLSSTDATGAQTQTTDNADGSTSTTITYSDGSTVSMTTPAASSEGGQSSGTSQSSGDSTSNPSSNNLLEQLIKMQSQLLTASSGSQSLVTA